jgi:hypothetical protein
VTEKEINRIIGILASDTTAVEKRTQIYGQLGLKYADLTETKRSLSPYDFFAWTLHNYKGENGTNATIDTLIDHFTQLKLTAVVGESSRFSD